jgi:hypothetical protein
MAETEVPGDSADSYQRDLLDQVRDLHTRALTVLEEFHAFCDYLRQNGRLDDVEMRIFRKGLEAEVETLAMAMTGKFRAGHGQRDLKNITGDIRRLIRSSNLTHYELWWSVAKQSQGLRALGRRVALPSQPASKGHKRSQQPGNEVQVDVMDNEGQQWIKISSSTQRRLILEMAKEGWEHYGDDSDEIEDVAEQKPPKATKIELLRHAEALQQAALNTRALYKHPKVRFILPRLHEGEQTDIDALLADMRRIGVTVECGFEVQHRGSERLADTFHRMCPQVFRPSPGRVLNLDCSILIALVSDQCHQSPSTLPSRPLNESRSYHAAILQQMGQEEHQPLLPTELYPLFADRALTCTSEAATRMRAIVDKMGTESERLRANIILGSHNHVSSSAQSIVALQALSAHAIPLTCRFPVQNVDVDVSALTTFSAPGNDMSERSSLSPDEVERSSYPRHIASRLARSIQLTPLNASVLFYGWQADLVTITSNGVAVRQVERGLNAVLDTVEGDGTVVDGFREPKFWLVHGSRSLVGKEKQSHRIQLSEQRNN